MNKLIGRVVATEKNPTTFYKSYYASNNSWDSEKTIYDPCPQGYRVPDGAENGVWAKAGFADASCETGNVGLMFQNNGQSVWYPASVIRNDQDGSLYYEGAVSYYWACSHDVRYSIEFAHCLSFTRFGILYPISSYQKTYGCSVRCLKEQ